jgi:hypothetical protein
MVMHPTKILSNIIKALSAPVDVCIQESLCADWGDEL